MGAQVLRVVVNSRVRLTKNFNSSFHTKINCKHKNFLLNKFSGVSINFGHKRLIQHSFDKYYCLLSGKDPPWNIAFASFLICSKCFPVTNVLECIVWVSFLILFSDSRERQK